MLKHKILYKKNDGKKRSRAKGIVIKRTGSKYWWLGKYFKISLIEWNEFGLLCNKVMDRLYSQWKLKILVASRSVHVVVYLYQSN